MVLHYQSRNTFLIDSITLNFLENRNEVRQKIGADYKEDNQIFEIKNSSGEYLYQRRDIYKNLNHSENFFFLNYDKDDLLSEVEVHYCTRIEILKVSFEFDDDLNSVASKLMSISPINKESEGEFLFKELGILIMSNSRVGGEGEGLGYFYFSFDISHLLDSV